jgi:hypothetical protein
MTGFSIDEIISNINNHKGFSFAAHYMMTITAPNNMGSTNDGSNDDFSRDLRFYCHASQLPGISLQNFEHRPYGYGLYERRPLFANFTHLPCQFLCDAEGKVIKFFQKWMASVYNFNPNLSSGNSTGQLKQFDLAFPEDYETRIEIETFDTKNQSIIKWTLEKAFPYDVSDMRVSWDGGNGDLAINILPVSFYYQTWTTEAITQNGNIISVKG